MPKIVFCVKNHVVNGVGRKMFHCAEYSLFTDTIFLHRDFNLGTFSLVRSQGDQICEGYIYDGAHGSHHRVGFKTGEPFRWGREKKNGSDFLSVDSFEIEDILTIEYLESSIPNAPDLSPSFDLYMKARYSRYVFSALPHFKSMSKKAREEIRMENKLRTTFCFNDLEQQI